MIVTTWRQLLRGGEASGGDPFALHCYTTEKPIPHKTGTAEPADMSVDALHDRMAWPSEKEILAPPGLGPRVLTDLAQKKIENAIRQESGDKSVRVGLLTRNPSSANTEAPIAVVCEFRRAASDTILALAHRLAWNFARSPLLVTVEPHQVRAWTCCERPSSESDRLFDLHGEIEEARLDLSASLTPSERAAHALHWVRLATGDFYRQFPGRFRRDGRADRILLKELSAVRRRLQGQGLANHEDTIHDLLARVVFSQFLFDRKDPEGTAALNPSLLRKLHDEGHLHTEHTELTTILSDYDEAYRFFRWLNEKFNGDLFPGKGQTPEEREAEWQAEMAIVAPTHLQTLADFVGGRMRGRQRAFWRLYRFDVIPLEFISSVYEEFVTTTGAHYTPGFLVDFMLDEVLPWEGDDWKVKILDPACGSGVFLVKAYQRLIQRWKNANPGSKPAAAVLRRLLDSCLCGCDIDPHAVRVASFSLYLTMCDEIDPKNYLRNTRFPRLRDERLIHADFFNEDQPGLSTKDDGPTYDLVVGNAPWEQDSETEAAREWARNPLHRWDIAHKNIGTLFLAKAATMTKASGRISMIQPASSLLFNRTGPARRFRERLFSQFRVTEIVNLSALRFSLFGVGKRAAKSTSPPCIVTMSPRAPDDRPLLYVCPKQTRTSGNSEMADGNYTIIVEPHDVSQVWADEAVSEPFIWTALAWGGRRDLMLVRKLSRLATMEEFEVEKHMLVSRRGVSRGESNRKRQSRILGMPFVDRDEQIDDVFVYLDASDLPTNVDPWTHEADSTDMRAFQLPQLVVKQSWQKRSQRFRAVIVRSDDVRGPVFCTRSYFSVHSRENRILEAAWLSLNSSVSVYYLLLTSGRLASWIPEPNKKDFMQMPLPEGQYPLAEINPGTVDEAAFHAFQLHPDEQVLVEDLFTFTIADFQGNETSPGRQRTERKPRLKTAAGREPHLADYCQYFIDVLKGGFGKDKRVCATIYQDAPQARLPVRLVAIHLDWNRQDAIVVETIDAADLCQRLLGLNEKYMQAGDGSRGGIFFQRIARVYVEERRGRRTVPTIYIIKPDRIRYWTRSAGMRDADEVAADMLTWQLSSTTTLGRSRK